MELEVESEVPDEFREMIKREIELDNYLKENDLLKEPEPEVVDLVPSSPPLPPPTQKRSRLRDMLKNLPNYQDIIKEKPKIQTDTNDNFICFESSNSKSENKNEDFENLMSRFFRHAALNKKPSIKSPKQFKIHLLKREEDSQGVEQLVLKEEEFNTTVEDDDILTTKETVPGASYRKNKDKLLSQIKEKKKKRLAELIKNQAIYEEEKDLEEKEQDQLPEDEIIEFDEDEEESEVEGDDENEDDGEVLEEEEEQCENEENNDDDGDMEDSEIPFGKKKRRYVFLEDEAEEDEDQADGGTGDILSEKEIVKQVEKEEKKEQKDFINDEEEEESLLSIPSPVKKDQSQEVSEVKVKRIAPTPLPLQRMESEVAIEAFAKEMANTSTSRTPPSPIPLEVKKLIGTQSQSQTHERSIDGLLDICSGVFPSQPPDTPAESEGTWESDGFQSFTEQTPTSPSNNTPKVVINSIGLNKYSAGTPSFCEQKLPKSRLDFSEIIINENEQENTDKIIVPESENFDDEEDEEIGKKVVRKRKRRLSFSDDEEDDNEEEKENKNNSLGFEYSPSKEIESQSQESVNLFEEEEKEEMDQMENNDNDEEKEELSELRVLRNKPENKKTYTGFGGLVSKKGKIRKEYVEDEAELSGDEMGSDEDEQGLDDLENEDGDEENFDEEDLRNQVGRAHLKQLIDEDQKDLRIIKELLLEDGEYHRDGKGRERQFKWKNLDKYDEIAVNAGAIGVGSVNEEDLEEERRQHIEKAEKLKWMSENSQLFDNDDEDSQRIFIKNAQKWTKNAKSKLKKSSTSSVFCEESLSLTNSSYSLKCSSKSSSKILEFNFEPNNSTNKILPERDGEDNLDSQEKSENSGALNLGEHLRNSISQPFFISPEVQIKMKGSFINRGTPILSKIAEMTKGTERAPINVKNNSKNFCFSVLTPPEENNKKAPLRRRVKPTKLAKLDKVNDSSLSNQGLNFFSQ